MNYSVKIDGLSEYPHWRDITTNDEGELASYRKQAAENARKAMPEWKKDNDGEHLVYYYELNCLGKDKREAFVLMTPKAVTDEDFQRFVNDFKPAYVGAIHRSVSMKDTGTAKS